MSSTDFSSVISAAQTPGQFFEAINNVRGWWSVQIEGPTNQLNETFNYHYQDIHRCRIKVIELVPGKKVVWQVLDNYFKFTAEQNEWPGTKIIFNISGKEGKTTLQFTHQGLVPTHECFAVCRDAWTNYIQNSLYSLITTGTGAPNAADKPQTADEKRMAAER